jgi:hypothetical protein
MAGSDRAQAGLTLTLQPRSERYDQLDDRWIAQVATLVSDLHREVGGVRRDTVLAPGRKGGFEAIVLALGSAGAFNAAVALFKAWLARDRGRSLHISFRDGDRERTVVIRGDMTDNATLQAVGNVVATQLGGR